jgi:integrase
MTLPPTHFKWKLFQRDGVYYADGRSNRPSVGKHSLGTRNRAEAEQLLLRLDRRRAEDLNLIVSSARKRDETERLTLTAGRALYEARLQLPAIAGGVRSSTFKRYRTVFDKFLAFAPLIGVENWNELTKQALELYTTHLTKKNYKGRTIFCELVVLKQTQHWLIKEGHLLGVAPVELRMHRPQGQPAYCWRPEEVDAILAHCLQRPDLNWLHDVLLTLTCTGLRISEAVGLRWTDIDLTQDLVKLTDESGFAADSNDTRHLKSGRSRTLALHPELKKLFSNKARRGRFVFAGPRGGRLNADTVRRTLIREVLTPLADRFPTPEGGRGFRDGRLHSFRHYFCSMSANAGVPEQIMMDWLGHSDSAMVRIYYHLHNDESRRQMASINFTGVSRGLSGDGQTELKLLVEDAADQRE